MSKVTGRRQAREWAVQFLFQTEFNPGDLEPALIDFWNDEEKKPSDRDRTYVEEMVRGVMDKRREVDRTISKYTDNWDVDRLGVLDRTVLRVATYEMLFRADIPPVVSINEAVEIAKAYISKESGRFVNGVLDRIQKELDRPSRSIQGSGAATKV
jgi:N utilization substance protein B